MASAAEETEHSPIVSTKPGGDVVLPRDVEPSGGDNGQKDESVPPNSEREVTPADGESPADPQQSAPPPTAAVIVATAAPASATAGPPAASQVQADLNEKSPHGRYVRVSPPTLFASYTVTSMFILILTLALIMQQLDVRLGAGAYKDV
jgi:uncharacterized membrane protein